MTAERISRRRAIRIVATSAAAVIAGTAAHGQATVDYEWRGLAMGADARIVMSGVDERTARPALAAAAVEIERLERALSLFRADSEISRLNRQGVLAGPPGDLRRALGLALVVADVTGGLFDPTVQPLWEAHVDWFAAAPQAGLPPKSALAAARSAVDWRKVRLQADRIRLGPGQRITLNGLGQGYVTDRIADMLRVAGFDHVLVDLGEQRALGPRDDGTPWQVAREGADAIELADGGLATSEGAGCVLGADGAAHHIFDPRSGRSAAHWRRITVHHRSAALADALSTALYVAGPTEIAALLARLRGIRVWATDTSGMETRWASAS